MARSFYGSGYLHDWCRAPDPRTDDTLRSPAYNRGKERRRPNAYQKIRYALRQAKGRKDWPEEKRLGKELRSIPGRDPYDPDYRRLHYTRYADDFLLGFSGPRHEAEEIKKQIGKFLHEELYLDLSEEKTLITQAQTEAARFLGYEIVVIRDDAKHTKGQRSINGMIGLKIPYDVIEAKCQAYMQHGKPVHLTIRTQNSVYSTITEYQMEYRGLVNYYALAYNLHRLKRLKWVMETSLAKTLAHKLKISVNQVFHKYQTQITNEHGTYKVLQDQVQRKGKPTLVATWGGIPLRWKKQAILDDDPPKTWNNRRTELVQRLLADECELCHFGDRISIHHVKSLKSLKKEGKSPKPLWIQWMAARSRKTIALCHTCHYAADAQSNAERMRRWHRRHTRKIGTGEPGDAKVSSPVRRGVDGKVPA